MKAVTLVLLWLLGSATAIGVAWSGVGVLDDDLVAPAPAVATAGGEVGLISESIDPLEEALDLGDETSALAAPTSTLDSTSTTTSGGNATTASTATTVATPTTSVTLPSTLSSTTTTTSSTSGPSSTTGTTSGGPASEQYETKIFTLIGGTTAIRFSPSSTKMLWANPNPGYEVRIEPESGGAKVEFRSDDHRSRIDAWWDDGPRHEIDEDD